MGFISSELVRSFAECGLEQKLLSIQNPWNMLYRYMRVHIHEGPYLRQFRYRCSILNEEIRELVNGELLQRSNVVDGIEDPMQI